MHDLNVPGADSGAGIGHARRHWQSGQTLVVVAVLLVVLIGFLGLVIDGGNVYTQRRQMQNAADAAALAGARALSLDQDVDAAVAEYATANGASGWEPPIVTETTVSVVVTKAVTTYFIRVLGITGVPVGAHAVAEIIPLTETSCPVMPLVVEDLPDFAGYTDQEFTIWDANPGWEEKCEKQLEGGFVVSPSEHGWVSLDPDEDCHTGASGVLCWECVENKKDCPRRSVAIGDWIPAKPGLVDSAAQDMECNLGDTVIIPLFDDVCDCLAPQEDSIPRPCLESDGVPCGGGCSLFYHISAFASVTVEEIVAGNGASGCKSFKVRWEDYMTSPECAEGDPDDDPTNAWTVRLIE